MCRTAMFTAPHQRELVNGTALWGREPKESAFWRFESQALHGERISVPLCRRDASNSNSEAPPCGGELLQRASKHLMLPGKTLAICVVPEHSEMRSDNAPYGGAERGGAARLTFPLMVLWGRCCEWGVSTCLLSLEREHARSRCDQ